MADISASFAGLSLRKCIYNASGARSMTPEELAALGNSEAGAILTKSCTLLPREGNPEPRYQDLEWGSLNSMGLPNLGYEKYIELSPELKKYGKPVFASVSGLSLEDNMKIIEAMNASEFDAVELNLSCPNIPGKPQVGYDFEDTEKYLEEISAICRKPLGLKLPPYFDFAHFEQMAGIIKKFRVRFLSCINAIGNALVIDSEKEIVIIKPKGGFGGLGGRYIKPAALANVRKFHELLPDIPIIGVGGIFTGRDVFEFVLAGATAVQLGTVLMQEGTSCFGRVARELEEIMDKKGYPSLERFRGKLKVIE
ncbi:MAG: dihydroorotate oxidase [Candidatus Aenigmarchaeota archaeon]|nr:dihydroorotate oxidase [Candidatus Aenigmarchaeota archaeon]